MESNNLIKHLELELLLRKHNKVVHTTKSGQKILVKDMSTEHIRNYLRKFYERKESMLSIADLY